MSKATHYTNAAMICYRCRRTAVVRFHLPSAGKESLDVHFVSCAVCHMQSTTKMPINVNTKSYAIVITSLEHIFSCQPLVSDRLAFSLIALRIGRFARTRQIAELFDVTTIPEENIMIIQEGREVRTDARFFHHERLNTNRETDLKDTPFASIATRLPVARNWSVVPLCPRCLAEIIPPPEYST
jgi:hypothetical protein